MAKLPKMAKNSPFFLKNDRKSAKFPPRFAQRKVLAGIPVILKILGGFAKFSKTGWVLS